MTAPDTAMGWPNVLKNHVLHHHAGGPSNRPQSLEKGLVLAQLAIRTAVGHAARSTRVSISLRSIVKSRFRQGSSAPFSIALRLSPHRRRR